ncbi:MAG: N-acetylmuramoyl-L-alanine amidase [Selenomonadaceae bacterium]|nr:N-acetylmuramoyl-L-alanine amidase [Selenomonadaceae bacterium]
MKVFINPGHGTNDPGACGFGLKESEVAAKIGAINIEFWSRLALYRAALFLYREVEQ